MTDQYHGVEYPENQRIIDCMKKRVNEALGAGAWGRMTCDGCPTGDMDNKALSAVIQPLVERIDEITDARMAMGIFSNVRHGLQRSDFAWARVKFLRYNDIDLFSEAILRDSMDHLKKCMEAEEAFYGQPITPEVYEYAKGIKGLFYGVRTGNTITATAIPFDAVKYLRAEDPRIKRYHACHCQFARESILDENVVSKTMCYCSLGHTKVFWEAALNTTLEGEVLASALAGDLSCRFVVHLPDEIMERYGTKAR